MKDNDTNILKPNHHTSEIGLLL